jgi:hypothetical protein
LRFPISSEVRSVRAQVGFGNNDVYTVCVGRSMFGIFGSLLRGRTQSPSGRLRRRSRGRSRKNLPYAAKAVRPKLGLPSFKHQRVVDCIRQILFRPQVPFRRQDRLMPQQKLNLLQLAALRAAEIRRRAPRIHARAATPRARSTRPCPLGRSRARAGRLVLSLSLPVQPPINLLLHPQRHRHRPRLVSLPLEIQKLPAAVAHRQMLAVYPRQFSAAQRCRFSLLSRVRRLTLKDLSVSRPDEFSLYCV